MNFIKYITEKIQNIGKEPQKIGLTQFKEQISSKSELQPSIKNKEVKLSDLMRRVS